MGNRLSKEQMDDLLIYCGSKPTYWKKDESLVCCPVHQENNASMGISEEKQICHCFSCGFAGDFAKLLLFSNPDEFGVRDLDNTKEYLSGIRKAREFLRLRYELEYRELGKKLKLIKRYESFINVSEKEITDVIPMYEIAPFMSGKETYKEFFDRGFNKEDLVKFKVGRDLENKTITLPVFNKEGGLLGVIGRYIGKRKKNQRYKIYNGFERSKFLYPLNLFKPKDDTIILVEGQFDVMRLHKVGYKNVYATMTNTVSDMQLDFIEQNCSSLIWLGDNDDRGIEAREKAHRKLKNKLRFLTVEYPDGKKDACNWTDREIHLMLINAKSFLMKPITRISY